MKNTPRNRLALAQVAEFMAHGYSAKYRRQGRRLDQFDRPKSQIANRKSKIT